MKFHIRVRACALIIENDSVLLIEFLDESGLHYNLPAGGVEPGESIIEAVRREAREEASIDVLVGPLAFVYENAPHLNEDQTGTHSVSLMSDCTILNDSVPRLPDKPDLHQIGVKWIPLAELESIVLYPNIRQHILNYAKDRSRHISLIEEHKLPKIDLDVF